MKMNNADSTEELFNDIIDMKYQIQYLGGFVQNDFEQMLRDGIITREDIKDKIVNMDISFNETIIKLNVLRERCRMIMLQFGKG